MGKRIEMEDETLKINLGKLNELLKIEDLDANVIKRLIPKRFATVGFGLTIFGSIQLGYILGCEGIATLYNYPITYGLVGFLSIVFGALLIDGN